MLEKSFIWSHNLLIRIVIICPSNYSIILLSATFKEKCLKNILKNVKSWLWLEWLINFGTKGVQINVLNGIALFVRSITNDLPNIKSVGRQEFCAIKPIKYFDNLWSLLKLNVLCPGFKFNSWIISIRSYTFKISESL